MLRFLKYNFNRLRYLLNVPLRVANEDERRRPHDGLLLPPPKLVFLIQWRYDLQLYWQSGVLGYECITDALKVSGFEPDNFKTVLDFGCGCGRLLRHWQPRTGRQFYGVDYNPDLIDWCTGAFPFAQFYVNRPLIPLTFFGDKIFDFVYASSVFTHLDQRNERFSMSEFHRILKPGGLALFTTKGERNSNQLSERERAKFRLGERIIKHPRYACTNICGVYHPRAYVEQVLAKGWSVVGFLEGGAKDQAYQDIYVVQKS
jgi:SAM-dependent methyltransferase